MSLHFLYRPQKAPLLRATLLGLLTMFAGQTIHAQAQTAPDGFIDVFALRTAVAKLESLQPTIDEESCETQSCIIKIEQSKKTFESARAVFMNQWGPALLNAIHKGDEVAEVIWRQCTTTPVIERAALASTCDDDPQRRAEAAKRLQQIGFEAAFDAQAEGNLPAWEPDQNKRTVLSQERTLREMKAGVYGGLTLDSSVGGNAPRNKEGLLSLQREAAIDAASTLVRRSFSHIRTQSGSNYGSHAQLRLNRKALGTPTLAWSANVFNSGHPYTGAFDPAWGGFAVYLQYDNHRKIMVGGDEDVQYLRMLYDTLANSEQRIDYWLKRDSRWSVFLLHRYGHHEWIPEGMNSPLAHLNPRWGGEWILDKTFVNFEPKANPGSAHLSIRVGQQQTVAQFQEGDTSPYACELRYSGANSLIPQNKNHAETATTTALGYLPSLAQISPHADGPAKPFEPMNPKNVYRQVLVQCPQGEWPDNRNKRFFFLAQNTLIEIYQPQGSSDLTIRHWQRKKQLHTHKPLHPLSPAYRLQPLLDKLQQQASTAQVADDRLIQLRATVPTMDTPALLSSLSVLRLEKLFYSPDRDFPENLKRLIATTDIAMEVCAAPKATPPDALTRFNFMVILNKRTRKNLLTAGEREIVPDCLRRALNDPNDWVRLEAIDVFSFFAEEKDRVKLIELQKNDPNEDVRRYTHNALIRLRK